jgi:LysM repeat protein
MKRARSLILIFAVPAVVSLVVTVAVLGLWDSRQGDDGGKVIVLPTHGPTSLINPLPLPTASGPIEGGEISSTTEIIGEVTQPPQGPCQNPVHIVVSGETLGVIATQYGLTVDDLIVMNQAVDPSFDPDFLAVGQQLTIPVCGPPAETLPTIPIETEAPTRDIPIPISTATEPPLGIISVQISRVLNPGDVTQEALQIVNSGAPVDLNGWTLTNGGFQVFTFPAFRLFTGGGVTVYTGVGQNTPIGLYWGLDSAIWTFGETAFLYDANGEEITRLEISEP